MSLTLPALEGKTFAITGANTGIGRVTAIELARAGAEVILLGRSLERTVPVVDEIRSAGGSAEFLSLDLSALDSVRQTVEKLAQLDRPIDVLVNNAGLAGHRGVTDDGFEIQFGVNHLGHYLLTRLLLDQGMLADGGRVVTVASRAHRRIRTLDLGVVRGRTRSFIGFREYANSKLSNVLFSAELARRYPPPRLTTYSLHPGVVATDIWRRLPQPVEAIARRFMITSEEGAQTTLFCATAPELAGDTGLYYDECTTREPSPAARDATLAQTLWERSAEWVGLAP